MRYDSLDKLIRDIQLHASTQGYAVCRLRTKKNLFAQDYQRVVTFVCTYVAPCICVPCVYVPRVCPLSVYPLCVCLLSVHRSVYMSPVYVPWRTVDLEITRCFHIARSYVAS